MLISSENFPEPFQSLDSNGCFIETNDAWLSMLGYEKDEIIGKSFTYILSDNEKPIFEKKFEIFKKNGSVHNAQFLLRHKLGHFIPSNFDGKIVLNSDNKKVTQCLFHDRTKDYEYEVRYKDIFNNATNAIVIYEVYNNGEDFVFTDLNPRVEEIENVKK